MSPRGYPDYTTPVTQITIEGFAGLEELAARLGSSVPWDVRGNILLMEDFESELLDWEDTSLVVGNDAVRSSRHKFSGDWSLKLHNIGGDDVSTTLERWLAYHGENKYALFARVHLDEDSQQFYLGISFWDGDHLIKAFVYYNLATTTLSVWTGGAGVAAVDTDLVLADRYEAWLPLLFTFDLETGYYDKLYFADNEYDISDRPLQTFDSELSLASRIELISLASVAGAFDIYFDNVVLAKNVP